MSDWISTQERQPDDAGHEDDFRKRYVLVWSPQHPEQALGRYVNGRWSFMGSNSDFSDVITHWMPIPEPPKSSKAQLVKEEA